MKGIFSSQLHSRKIVQRQVCVDLASCLLEYQSLYHYPFQDHLQTSETTQFRGRIALKESVHNSRISSLGEV